MLVSAVLAPSWSPSQATVAWLIRVLRCPSCHGCSHSWFTLEYNRLLFLKASDYPDYIYTTFQHQPHELKSSSWCWFPAWVFDFLFSGNFPQGNFISQFPLPFSETEFGGGHTTPSQQKPRTNVLSLQETLSILCKLTSSSPRTSFTEQNTPVFSGSGGLWLRKSEDFLF